MRMAQVDSNKILARHRGVVQQHRQVGLSVLGKLAPLRNCIAISKIENIVEDMTEALRLN